MIEQLCKKYLKSAIVEKIISIFRIKMSRESSYQVEFLDNLQDLTGDYEEIYNEMSYAANWESARNILS